MTHSIPSQDAWTRAKNRYTEDLSEQEKKIYYTASLESIFYDASSAAKVDQANSKSRKALQTLEPFFACLEDYSSALDVYSNAYPLVLSPLWGSVRVILHIAREFGKYFEKLLDMFSRIGDVLPRFRIYERLFPNHERLVQALSLAYVDIISFCSNAKEVFRHGQRSSKTALKVALKVSWKPFERQFGQQLEGFRRYQKNVEKEADLSHMIEAADSRAIVKANNLQVEKLRCDDDRRRVLSMLAGIDVQAKQNKLEKMRYSGTGDWVLVNDVSIHWKSANNSASLLCHGIPGCGKSVPTSRIVEDTRSLESGPSTTVLFYYFDHADQRTLEFEIFLNTILKQFLVLGQISPELVLKFIHTYRNVSAKPGENDLVETICSMIESCGEVCLIVDGLDECEKQVQREILAFLDRLSRLQAPVVKIFVSCREETHLLQALSPYPRIHLSPTTLSSDIKSFVQGTVRSRITSGELQVKGLNLEREITTELISKAQGMFLWVFFQLEELCDAPSEAAIRDTLMNLPLGLAETYRRILNKITTSQNNTRLAEKVFYWLIHAQRPLCVEELQEAVAFGPEDKFWDVKKIPARDSVIRSCKGLVIREEMDETVRFAHHTVKQYLLEPKGSETISTNDQVNINLNYANFGAGELAAQTCLAYLSFSDFESQLTKFKPEDKLKTKSTGIFEREGPAWIPRLLGMGFLFELPYRVLGRNTGKSNLRFDASKILIPAVTAENLIPSGLIEHYKLLQYVIEFWEAHTRSVPIKKLQKLRGIALEKNFLFEHRPWGANKHFGRYGCKACPDPESSEDLPFTSLLHYAAEVGNLNLLHLSNRVSGQPVGRYWFHEQYNNETLLIACRHGQKDFVEHLWKLHTFDTSDGRAAITAAAHGHASVLEFLLSGMRTSFQHHGNAPLHVASQNGHVSVVVLLLKNNYGVDIPSGHFRTPYIDSKDPLTNRTAIQSAAMNGHDEIVRTLLEYGAQVSRYIPSHREDDTLNLSMTNVVSFEETALHLAVENGHEKVVHSLLHHLGEVALIAYRDEFGDTPLMKAASRGQAHVVKLLLEASNANDSSKTRLVYVRNPAGYTAFHIAAENGHVSVLKELGAACDVCHVVTPRGLAEHNKRTALHLAAIKGHASTIGWLIEHGADLNVKDSKNLSPLQHSVIEGHEPAVRELLNLGAEAGFVDGTDSLLSLAAREGHENIVETLFELRPEWKQRSITLRSNRRG